MSPARSGRGRADQVRAYQAEQRRRLLNLLALTARGRESRGHVDLALKDYRDLYEAASRE